MNDVSRILNIPCQSRPNCEDCRALRPRWILCALDRHRGSVVSVRVRENYYAWFFFFHDLIVGRGRGVYKGEGEGERERGLRVGALFCGFLCKNFFALFCVHVRQSGPNPFLQRPREQGPADGRWGGFGREGHAGQAGQSEAVC